MEFFCSRLIILQETDPPPRRFSYLSSGCGVLWLLVVSDPEEAGEPQGNALLWIHLRADMQIQSGLGTWFCDGGPSRFVLNPFVGLRKPL